jgi:uncharacterized membrane protein
MSACKNCEHPLNVEDKHCPSCGQKKIERLTIRTLLGELANAFFAWDSKLFRSLKLLLFKPGVLAANYIQGKRKSFVAPMRLYLFFSIIFFGVLSLLGISVGESDGESQGMVHFDFGADSSSVTNDSLYLMTKHDRLDELEIVEGLDGEFNRQMMKQIIKISVNNDGHLSTFFIKNISFMYFFFIPVFGLFLKLFHRKRKLDYIEHLVYGLYFHSFLFFLLFLTLPFARLTDSVIPILLALVIIVVYFVKGMKTFYAASWGLTLLKSFFTSAIYLLFFLLFAFVTLFLTIWFY